MNPLALLLKFVLSYVHVIKRRHFRSLFQEKRACKSFVLLTKKKRQVFKRESVTFRDWVPMEIPIRNLHEIRVLSKIFRDDSRRFVKILFLDLRKKASKEHQIVWNIFVKGTMAKRQRKNLKGYFCTRGEERLTWDINEIRHGLAVSSCGSYVTRWIK